MLPISIKFVKKPDFLKSKYSNFFINHTKSNLITVNVLFSAGGLFLTKLRSSMSDMTLDKLMFLKFFFKLRKDKVF